MEDSELSRYEILARNIYYTSQYSNSSGIKRNFLYPKYKRESKDFPGRHICRVSVQRLCLGKWSGVVASALKTKSNIQELKGFSLVVADTIRKYGFYLEPASHEKNPYHAHIVIPELDLQYPTLEDDLESVMNSGLKRRIDELSEEFEYIPLKEIDSLEADCYSPSCNSCLSSLCPPISSS